MSEEDDAYDRLPRSRRRSFDDVEIRRLAAQIRRELSDDWDARIRLIVEAAEKTTLAKLGVDTNDMDNMSAFRANLNWVQNRRAFEQQMVRQGVGAVILALVGGILTAIWFYLVGSKR